MLYMSQVMSSVPGIESGVKKGGMDNQVSFMIKNEASDASIKQVAANGDGVKEHFVDVADGQIHSHDNVSRSIDNIIIRNCLHAFANGQNVAGSTLV